MKRSQLRQLEFLVFKRGGVAGAIRRIVYRFAGVFTSSMVYARLIRKYPLLEPNDGQLLDCLAVMELQRRIERVLVNACAIFYKLSAYQLWFKFS